MRIQRAASRTRPALPTSYATATMDLYDGNIVRIQPGQPTNALRFVQVMTTPFTLQLGSRANEPLQNSMQQAPY